MAGEFPLDVKSLLTVLDYLNLGVYITDTDRRIILWNRKAEEIVGHKAEDVVGKTCYEDVLNHVDKDQHELCTTELCPLARTIRLNKESESPLLVFAQRADGARVAVSVSTAPLRDPSGRVIGGIETFRDESATVHDMEFARRVQRHILPQALPQPSGFTFEVGYFPHDLIGGDFYDVRELEAGQYAFMVADVRGHGVSAALYTMCLKSMSEGLAHLAGQPGEFMTAVNRELSRFVLDESFATAFYGVLDRDRSRIRYTNAGHPAPLCFSAASRTLSTPESHGMPLGIMGEGAYESSELTLSPGDMLLCYTDGVTEAVNEKGEEVGEAGLAELLQVLITQGERPLLDTLYRHVKVLCGNVSLSDNVLLLSLSRKAENRG